MQWLQKVAVNIKIDVDVNAVDVDSALRDSPSCVGSDTSPCPTNSHTATVPTWECHRCACVVLHGLAGSWRKLVQNKASLSSELVSCGTHFSCVFSPTGGMCRLHLQQIQRAVHATQRGGNRRRQEGAPRVQRPLPQGSVCVACLQGGSHQGRTQRAVEGCPSRGQQLLLERGMRLHQRGMVVGGGVAPGGPWEAPHPPLIHHSFRVVLHWLQGDRSCGAPQRCVELVLSLGKWAAPRCISGLRKQFYQRCGGSARAVLQLPGE